MVRRKAEKILLYICRFLNLPTSKTKKFIQIFRFYYAFIVDVRRSKGVELQYVDHSKRNPTEKRIATNCPYLFSVSLTNNMGGAQSAFRAPPTSDEISIQQIDTSDRSNRFAGSDRPADITHGDRSVFASFNSNSPLYSSTGDCNRITIDYCNIV